MNSDEFYMKKALHLAKLGEGYVSPNPMVGCVIVKDDEIISEGYHQEYGKFHAERNAILNCKDNESLKGATLYVTLEPCCHYGKTPPCTDIIIQSEIKRCVVGCVDDNPLVENKGIKILKEHGIDVTLGVLEEECRKLNEVFFHYINTKTPFIAMKFAQTADGKIASFTGHSKYITGEKAREHVHTLRNKYSSIMVGIGTVLCDNPMLTCRNGGKNPIRIICDTHLKIPLDSNIAKTAKDVKTYVATGENADNEKIKALENAGVEVIKVPLKNKYIDFTELIKKLGKLNIDSVLLEGGGTLNYSAVESGLVNKVYSYIAAKILGGINAKTPVEGTGFEFADKCFMLSIESVETIGNDILITYTVNPRHTQNMSTINLYRR